MFKFNILTKILVITVSIFITLNLNQISAESSLSKYNRDLEQVRDKEKENMEKLSGIEKEIAEYNYEIADLDSKMMLTTLDLAELREKEEKLNEALEKSANLLNDSSKLYEYAENLYISRLRVIYENGVPDIYEFLFSSKGIIDFLAKVNAYESILEYNKDLLSKIKGKKNYVDYVKRDIENQKLELSQLESDVGNKLDELNNTLSKKKSKVEELENSQSILKSNSEELVKKREDALKNIENEIEKAYRATINSNGSSSSTEFTGGDFAWPVPGYNVITTTFGFVYYLVNPNGSAHTGCDIAGADIFGKPIVAAESGTVIVAGYNEGGYGNYVMIDHGNCTEDGNNYITLYGHASALAVQKGDKVIKGDTIAYVGSTGNSTGPHLHFEIRVNGKITDPLIQYPSLNFDYR